MIRSVRDLRPGDIGLGPIGGLVGFGAGLGQWALGEGWSLPVDEEVSIKIRHACIVTQPAIWEESKGVTAWPEYAEAMPSGARLIRANRWLDDWAWVRIPEDYPGQAADAAEVARMMVQLKTPYSVKSYRYLARWRLGLDSARMLQWINRRQDPPAWTLPSGRRLTAGLPREAICSVFDDQAWTSTGKKIVYGVPYQCVTPKGLANALRAMPDAWWAFPGR